MLHLRAANRDETRAIAAALASLARPGDLIVLSGEMGAGKTAFAQGFGTALGVTDPITSPTYTLVHSYPTSGRVILHHADLYRLSTYHDVADLALGELLEEDGIVLVEWGDVVAGAFGEHLGVHLEHDVDDDARLITVSASGNAWATRWERLRSVTSGFSVSGRSDGAVGGGGC